jgi:hypothetical protein
MAGGTKRFLRPYRPRADKTCSERIRLGKRIEVSPLNFW